MYVHLSAPLMASKSMTLIYKINFNAIRISRPQAFDKILPKRYMTEHSSDHDFAVIFQLNSTFSEIILVKVNTEQKHDIVYISFLHSTRVIARTVEHLDIFQKMMDVLLENTTDDMHFSIKYRYFVPLTETSRFESLNLQITSSIEMHQCYKISPL